MHDKNLAESEELTTEFKTMDQIINKPVALAYCDYIAAAIQRGLLPADIDNLLTNVGPVKYDFDRHGALLSTKKTIEVTDKNGTRYRITVEEA